MIIDIKLKFGKEWTEDENCDLVLIEGFDTWESNSILVRSSLTSENFYGLCDETISFGCEISLEMNEDYNTDSASCSGGTH